MIKPYYKTDLGVLYHGDCLEIMPMLEPVDLVLTDPPYGINYQASNPSVKKGLGLTPIKIKNDSTLINLRPILNMDCEVISFGANCYPEQLPHRGRWICWDKRVIESADRMLGSPFELAWRNIDHGFDTMIRIMHGGVVNSDRGKRYHPTQKPIALMVRILSGICKKAELVLDPFIGSGTVAIACQILNRRWIGIEIEEKYCEIAAKRIEMERSQLKLW